MSVPVEWWMYLAHAFSPMMLLLASPLLLRAQHEAAAITAGTTSEAIEPIAAQTPTNSVNARALIFTSCLITQLLTTAIMYGFWLGAHWLVFWFLGKPLHLDVYFYKPALLAYWFPYLFGAATFSYYALAKPLLHNAQLKNLLHGIIVIGTLLSTYMVFITYLAWL